MSHPLILIPQTLTHKLTTLNSPLSLHEFTQTTLSLPNNKAPGLDGLGIEVYKTFPDLIKILWQAFTSFNGTITSHLNQGKIILLHKKGPKNDLNNYCPLTMLNTDYKIITKALATRLQLALPSIIHPDQTGFIKGRSIKSNIIEAILLQHTRLPPTAAYLLLDFTKAFDQVDHQWIEHTMQAFGLGENFISWTAHSYLNASSIIELSSISSSPFNIARGVRQGCPLAPLLFILAQEPLALAIRHSEKIQGIKAHNLTFKLAMYADDTCEKLACNLER